MGHTKTLTWILCSFLCPVASCEVGECESRDSTVLLQGRIKVEPEPSQPKDVIHDGGILPIDVSTLELTGKKKWIINFKSTISDGDEKQFCSNPPGSSVCTPSGHPSEGGVPFVEFTGTPSELKQILKQHPDLKPTLVEQDAPVSAVPEMGVSMLDGDSDLGSYEPVVEQENLAPFGESLVEEAAVEKDDLIQSGESFVEDPIIEKEDLAPFGESLLEGASTMKTIEQAADSNDIPILPGAKTWIVNFGSAVDAGDEQTFCADPPGKSVCHPTGNPPNSGRRRHQCLKTVVKSSVDDAEGGSPCVEFIGTERELKELMNRHANLKPTPVEKSVPA